MCRGGGGERWGEVGSLVWWKWAGRASLTLAGLNHMWQKPDFGLTPPRLYSAFPPEAWELISTEVGISCFLFGSQLFATSFVPTGITGPRHFTGERRPREEGAHLRSPATQRPRNRGNRGFENLGSGDRLTLV